MKRNSHLERYHESQLGSLAWDSERQQRLKRRVFETFSQWLETNGCEPLRPGSRVVDLGSGAGHFVECCKAERLDACGIDIADGVNLETDAVNIADDTIDVVTAISVIEHLHSPANMLTEAMRILKPGGAMILVTPNWQYSMRTFFDDPTHVHPYSPSSLRQVLDMYGYKHIEVVPWLVKKPAWLWFVPARFFVANRMIPFRGDAPAWIPGFLKGRSASLLAIGQKSKSGA